MFVHTAGKYTTMPEEYKYKKTRNGVDATCKIYDLSGQLVGTLHDKASAIVAWIDFVSIHAQKAFESDARAVFPNESQSMIASEYARKLTCDAEKAWVAHDAALNAIVDKL